MRPEIERRLELVGLQREVLDRYPIELSGGMKQRMVMVISTLLNPSLLIADEITSALDVSTQKAVAETLVEFRDRKFVRSMIVITHDVSILSEIADTITVMYAGKLAEKAATDVIIGAPKHPYTQPADLVAPGGRRQVRGQAAVGHPRQPAGPPEPAGRMSLPGSMPPRRRSSAARNLRSWRSSATTSWPAGRRRDADADARPDLQGLQGRHLRRHGPDGGARGELRRRCRPGRLAHRRERQRQDHDRPDDPAADPGHARHDHVRRPGRGRACRARRTTGRSRGSSRTRSARTTRSSRPITSSA